VIGPFLTVSPFTIRLWPAFAFPVLDAIKSKREAPILVVGDDDWSALGRMLEMMEDMDVVAARTWPKLRDYVRRFEPDLVLMADTPAIRATGAQMLLERLYREEHAKSDPFGVRLARPPHAGASKGQSTAFPIRRRRWGRMTHLNQDLRDRGLAENHTGAEGDSKEMLLGSCRARGRGKARALRPRATGFSKSGPEENPEGVE